nr:hypothetical protein [Tanacetum cinerariifolium]
RGDGEVGRIQRTDKRPAMKMEKKRGKKKLEEENMTL